MRLCDLVGEREWLADTKLEVVMVTSVDRVADVSSLNVFVSVLDLLRIALTVCVNDSFNVRFHGKHKTRCRRSTHAAKDDTRPGRWLTHGANATKSGSSRPHTSSRSTTTVDTTLPGGPHFKGWLTQLFVFSSVTGGSPHRV